MHNQFKALNAEMSFGQPTKYISEKYSKMPSAVKESYIARVDEDKTRYLRELASYKPPPGYDFKGDAIIFNNSSSHPRPYKDERVRNVPKRNISAYILYQNAMHEEFKRGNPNMTFGQLAKYTAYMYRNLSSEVKASWDTRAQEVMIRYKHQGGIFDPPQCRGACSVVVNGHHSIKTRAKRKAKDPNAPKRALSAYVFFSNELRPVLTKQFPRIKFIETGRLLGERWRSLSFSEKKRYEDMASRDKIRFQTEMQQYFAANAAYKQNI